VATLAKLSSAPTSRCVLEFSMFFAVPRLRVRGNMTDKKEEGNNKYWGEEFLKENNVVAKNAR
jgi:hypothetical protein